MGRLEASDGLLGTRHRHGGWISEYGGIDLDYSGLTVRVAVQLFMVPGNDD